MLKITSFTIKIAMISRYILIGLAVGVIVSAIAFSILIFMYPTSTSHTTISISNQTIPLDQNNKEIHLDVGKRFLLNLDEKYDWNVNVDNQTVVNRVINIMENQNMQWIYKSNVPGKSTITATGNPICLKETPPCKLASIILRVNVIVT